MPMTIGERIREARRLLGESEGRTVTQAEFARRCGWESQSRVGNYEAERRTPSIEDARRIAAVAGVSESWLMGADPMASTRTVQASANADVESNVIAGPSIYRQVPEISWVQAGAWCEIMDEFYPGDGNQLVPVTRSVGPHTFALRVKGDSMEPRFPEGSLIVVDPERPADPGSFVVARLEESKEATFKQLVHDSGRKYLRPLNTQYPMIEINGEATVVGVVVQAIQEI